MVFGLSVVIAGTVWLGAVIGVLTASGAPCRAEPWGLDAYPCRVAGATLCVAGATLCVAGATLCVAGATLSVAGARLCSYPGATLCVAGARLSA